MTKSYYGFFKGKIRYTAATVVTSNMLLTFYSSYSLFDVIYCSPLYGNSQGVPVSYQIPVGQLSNEPNTQTNTCDEQFPMQNDHDNRKRKGPDFENCRDCKIRCRSDNANEENSLQDSRCIDSTKSLSNKQNTRNIQSCITEGSLVYQNIVYDEFLQLGVYKGQFFDSVYNDIQFENNREESENNSLEQETKSDDKEAQSSTSECKTTEKNDRNIYCHNLRLASSLALGCYTIPKQGKPINNCATRDTEHIRKQKLNKSRIAYDRCMERERVKANIGFSLEQIICYGHDKFTESINNPLNNKFTEYFEDQIGADIPKDGLVKANIELLIEDYTQYLRSLLSDKTLSETSCNEKDNLCLAMIPDFEKYHKRRFSPFRAKSGAFLICSQEWIIQKQSKAHLSIYTDIFRELKSLKYGSSEKLILQKTIAICDQNHLTPSFVMSGHDKNGEDVCFIEDFLQHKMDQVSKVTFADVPKNHEIERLDAAGDFAEKSQIFISFVIQAFYCKEPGVDCYKIKPQLWRLQIVMPEIYLYGPWRFKMLQNLAVNNNRNSKKKNRTETPEQFVDDMYGLKKEMGIIIKLIRAFHLYSTATNNQESFLLDLKQVVQDYRRSLLEMLEFYHHDTTQHIFHKIAFYKSSSKEEEIYSHKQADVLHMLAFAAESKSLKNLAVAILKGKDFFSPGSRIFSVFIRNKLWKRKNCKYEAITILLSVVNFLKQVKPSANLLDSRELYMIAVFDYHTVLISPGEHLGHVNIRFQTQPEGLQLFHRFFYSLFAN